MTQRQRRSSGKAISAVGDAALAFQPGLARNGLRQVRGKLEVDLRAVEAMAGVGPKHGRRGKTGQPGVHLLANQPGRPIKPLLRRAGEELQVRGHRTVLAHQRIGLSLRPGAPRGLAGLVRVVVLERYFTPPIVTTLPASSLAWVLVSVRMSVLVWTGMRHCFRRRSSVYSKSGKRRVLRENLEV